MALLGNLLLVASEQASFDNLFLVQRSVVLRKNGFSAASAFRDKKLHMVAWSVAAESTCPVVDGFLGISSSVGAYMACCL